MWFIGSFGSSSGIGKEIAIKLWSLGANVVITGRDDKRIAEVVDKCQTRDNQRALGMKADLLVIKDCRQLISKTISEFGKLDILINNAYDGQELGKVFRAPDYLHMYNEIKKARICRIKLLTQLAMPHLELTKGHVVNITNVASKPSSSGLLSHAIPKCTMDMFTERLAIRLMPKGIHVNSVNLCVTTSAVSPVLNEVTGDTNGLALNANYCRERYPSGRLDVWAEVAEVVATAISEGTHSLVTGCVMTVIP